MKKLFILVTFIVYVSLSACSTIPQSGKHVQTDKDKTIEMEGGITNFKSPSSGIKCKGCEVTHD